MYLTCCTSTLLFETSPLQFIMLFMNTATRLREETRYCICLERVSAVIFCHFSQAALLSSWVQSYKFSSAQANKIDNVTISNSSIFFDHRISNTEFVKEIVVQLRHSQLCKLKYPLGMGAQCSIVDFNNSTSNKSFSTVFTLLNSGHWLNCIFPPLRCFVIVCLDLSMI